MHLWYTEWLANRDLLYRTGTSTQYSVTVYLGKESEKEGIVSMRDWVTLWCSRTDHNIVNQLYPNKLFKKFKKVKFYPTFTDGETQTGLSSGISQLVVEPG